MFLKIQFINVEEPPVEMKPETASYSHQQTSTFKPVSSGRPPRKQEYIRSYDKDKRLVAICVGVAGVIAILTAVIASLRRMEFERPTCAGYWLVVPQRDKT